MRYGAARGPASDEWTFWVEESTPAALGERGERVLHRTVRTNINSHDDLTTVPTGPDDEAWNTTDSEV